MKEQESEASDRQGLPSHPSHSQSMPSPCKCSSRERLCWVLSSFGKMLLVLVAMLFASELISASILHLYGQTLPSGSEGSHQESHRGKRIYVSFFQGSHQKKTKKLFLGNEAEKLAPDEARKRLGKLVGTW